MRQIYLFIYFGQVSVMCVQHIIQHHAKKKGILVIRV